MQSPTLGSTLVRCPSPSGSFNVRQVALYWLPALPPHRFDGRGVFLVVPCRGTKAPQSSLVGFGASPECSGFASARSLLLRFGPLQEGNRPFQSLAGPPLVGFLLPRTPLRRVPLFRHALPLGRTCGTGVTTLPPVPSSGFLPLSTVLAARGSLENLAALAVRRGPRRFAVFFHTARVPGASLQSFPFPGSRTRSRGPFLPCGFRVRLPPAQCPRDLHGRFPRLLVPTLCPFRTRPKADPGRMSRDDGSSRSLVRSPRHAFAYRTYRPLPTFTGLAG